MILGFLGVLGDLAVQDIGFLGGLGDLAVNT
jgi:hypothetical protein